MKKRILSGMRPTGPLHVGHLLGALDNWRALQEEYQCFFMVADWHAMMSEYANPETIRRFTVDNVVDWLSYGLDPEKSVIFRQSDVPEHLELYMVFSCMTPLPWLERCPTYKEQLREVTGRDLTTYGFLGYPVLQAADILVYKANAVPVGEDQLPHLELTREIARRYNDICKKDVFPMPKPLLTSAPKLLGTDNRKMSKSYNNYIALSDTPAAVKSKVMSMITDPQKIKMGDPGRPDVCNVYSYHKMFSNQSGEVKGMFDKCAKGTLGCVECKKILAQALVEFLKVRVQENRKKYTLEKAEEILNEGAKRAREAAGETMREVRDLMGLPPSASMDHRHKDAKR